MHRQAFHNYSVILPLRKTDVCSEMLPLVMCWSVLAFVLDTPNVCGGGDVLQPLKGFIFYFPFAVQVVGKKGFLDHLLVAYGVSGQAAAWKRVINPYFLQHNMLFDCYVVPGSQESIQLWLLGWSGLNDFVQDCCLFRPCFFCAVDRTFEPGHKLLSFNSAKQK